METSFPPKSRRPSFRRAFRPFWIALVLSALLLSYDYHSRHAPFTRITANVTFENVEPDEGVILEVNGRKQVLDSVVPIGFNKIRIYGASTETAVFDRFIWYGVTDFGAVNLTRSRGSLVAQVTPTPSSYQLVGSRGNWSNADGGFTNVPVGRYRLVSRIGGLVDETEVDVLRNQINRIQVVAKIGSLELTSVPAEGEYELISGATNERRTGKFPETIQYLTEGRYRLIARRPDYQRDYQLDILRNQTNRVEVKFVYGAAEVATTPAGATIFWAGNERGISPLKLNQIVPGNHPVEVRLEGFDTASFQASVEGDAITRLAVTLVNTRYRESMDGARQSLEQKQFGRAVKYLESALAAKPEDPVAKELLPGTRGQAFRDRAEELRGQGDYEASLKSVESALADIPGDPAILALQERIRTERSQTTQQRIEGRYRQAMEDAKALASRQEFQRALVSLAEAGKLIADRPEVVEVETAIRRDQAKFEAALALKKQAAVVEARKNQFKAAWEKAMSMEANAGSFPEYNWKSSKSAAEILAALERLGSANPKWKVSELTKESDGLFSAMLGAPPKFHTGYYARVVVFTHADGNTQIRAKVFLEEKDLNPMSPDSRADYIRWRGERLRVDLGKQLDSEVK